jgi:hypothetical protein
MPPYSSHFPCPIPEISASARKRREREIKRDRELLRSGLMSRQDARTPTPGIATRALAWDLRRQYYTA